MRHLLKYIYNNYSAIDVNRLEEFSKPFGDKVQLDKTISKKIFFSDTLCFKTGVTFFSHQWVELIKHVCCWTTLDSNQFVLLVRCSNCGKCLLTITSYRLEHQLLIYGISLFGLWEQFIMHYRKLNVISAFFTFVIIIIILL